MRRYVEVVSEGVRRCAQGANGRTRRCCTWIKTGLKKFKTCEEIIPEHLKYIDGYRYLEKNTLDYQCQISIVIRVRAKRARLSGLFSRYDFRRHDVDFSMRSLCSDYRDCVKRA